MKIQGRKKLPAMRKIPKVIIPEISRLHFTNTSMQWKKRKVSKTKPGPTWSICVEQST